MGERLTEIRFVIRDHDSKFSGPFDEVFLSQDIQIVKTPIRAPRANAFAERWVRTVRTECLDWVLIFSGRHLECVLRTYIAHYNERRPHRGLELKTPVLDPDPASTGAEETRFGRTVYSAGLSTSTSWPLEVRSMVSVPFRLGTKRTAAELWSGSCQVGGLCALHGVPDRVPLLTRPRPNVPDGGRHSALTGALGLIDNREFRAKTSGRRKVTAK